MGCDRDRRAEISSPEEKQKNKKPQTNQNPQTTQKPPNFLEVVRELPAGAPRAAASPARSAGPGPVSPHVKGPARPRQPGRQSPRRPGDRPALTLRHPAQPQDVLGPDGLQRQQLGLGPGLPWRRISRSASAPQAAERPRGPRRQLLVRPRRRRRRPRPGAAHGRCQDGRRPPR